jgi:hypothetical protein
MARQYELADWALEDPFPEAPALGWLPDTGFNTVAQISGENSQSPEGGGKQSLEAGTKQARQHRSCPPGGYRRYHRRAVNDGRKGAGTQVRLINHIDRDLLLAGQR